MATKALVKIEDLYSEKIELAQENQLNILLNQPPKKEWLKPHPIAKKVIYENGEKKSVPCVYIPIERTEWMLTNIFIKWRVEVKDYKLIGNSVGVDVRLHYLSPISNEWDYQDGLGACPLQTDAGQGAIDFMKLKSSAVQIALPAAESYAVKDAAEKIGKLFGKDLNRADEIAYDTLRGKFDEPDLEFNNKFQELLSLLEQLEIGDQADFKSLLGDAKKKNTLNLEFVVKMIALAKGKLQ